MREAILQRLFDTSLNHIRAQGEKSGKWESNHFVCEYQHLEPGKTLSCAAAPFILDYVEEMENKDWQDVCRCFPNNVDEAARNEEEFVAELQGAHDESSDVCERFLPQYEVKMKQIAYLHDLDYTEPHDDC